MGKPEQRLRKMRAGLKQERRDGLLKKLLCENCGKLFVERELTRFDPFQEEVYNKRVPMRLCNECAGEALRDV